jgi:hypothetical protein
MRRRRRTFLEIERNFFDALFAQKMKDELDPNDDLPHIRWLYRNGNLFTRKINLHQSVENEPYQSGN